MKTRCRIKDINLLLTFVECEYEYIGYDLANILSESTSPTEYANNLLQYDSLLTEILDPNDLGEDVLVDFKTKTVTEHGQRFTFQEFVNRHTNSVSS